MDYTGKIFKNRIFKTELLQNVGFTRLKTASNESFWRLERSVQDGDLKAVITLFSQSNEQNIQFMKIDVKLIDKETGEEYLPAFIDSYQGKYVGAVREELRLILEEIARGCTVENDGRPPAWIIPANPKHYDIEKGFAESPDGTLLWTQRIKAAAGDTLFIYHTEPIASLTFRCTITEANIPTDPAVGDGFTKGRYLMRIRKEEQYPAGMYPRSFLNEHGIKKTVRGQRSCPDDLYNAVMKEKS